MKEALFIFFGWFLGLISHPIVSRIEKYNKRKDLKAAILLELKSLIVKLAAMYFKIQMHFGHTDQSSLIWVNTIFEKYTEDGSQYRQEIKEELSKHTNKEIGEVSSFFKADENISILFVKLSIPFIESIIEHLPVFDLKFQRDIFEVRAQITIINPSLTVNPFFSGIFKLPM